MDYHALWVRLNRPSPARFDAALKKRGIVSPGAAWFRENYYSEQSAKQLFAPPPKYTGHIYSPHLDSRWAADIMVNNQRPAKDKTGKLWSYALVVQDIFSRFAWAELIDSPMTAHVGLQAILDRAGGWPKELVTDQDKGFQTPEFRRLLARYSIAHEFSAARNDLSTVDRLIFTLKRALAEREAATMVSWARRLQQAVRGHNEIGTPHLYGSAPEDVARNRSLQFDLEWDESHAMRDNAKQIQARAEKINRLGAYRVFIPAKGLRRRANQPIWTREVHRGEAEGAFVDGHPTKEVLPVPAASAGVAPPLPQLKPEARRLLNRYRARVAAYVAVAPATMRSVYRVMQEEAGSRENLLNAFRIARVSTREIVPALVRVYPDYLKLEGGRVSRV